MKPEMLLSVFSNYSDNCTYTSNTFHGVYDDIDLAEKRCLELLKSSEFNNSSFNKADNTFWPLWSNDHEEIWIEETIVNKDMDV